MKSDNEMRFLGDSDDQPTSSSPLSNDGSTSSKLANAKMVRIRFDTKCALTECYLKKPYYQINTISKIDDDNPKNENELPLLEAEKITARFCANPVEFTFTDAQSKKHYSTSRHNGFGIKHCGILCIGESYKEFPDIISNKAGKDIDISTTKCYDSRSFYRTFEYQGRAYYKLGKPYDPEDKKCNCPCPCCTICCPEKDLFVCPCCCFQIKEKKCECVFSLDKLPCCFCCKKEEEPERRTYIDIFNMSDQCVGKYVHYFYQTGCPCPICGFCQTTTEFFEVYFPSDANELLKLSLIGHLLFVLDLGPPIFGTLPGTKENLDSWVE